MQAREIITEIVNVGIKERARSAGFRKKGFNFFRRCGEVVQVVNIQLSHSNFADVGRFYVNVGLEFDRLCNLAGKPVVEQPSHVECSFRRRLQNFVPEVDDAWNVDSCTDVDAVAAKLSTKFEELLDRLDPIDSIDALVGSDMIAWVDFVLRARMFYVLGNDESAAQYVNQQASLYAANPFFSFESLIGRHNLSRLKG